MDRMDRTGLWGRPRLLLLLLWVSGLRGEDEEQMCLLEGSNLTISCLYTRQYASSLKAWQRVRGPGPPETLVRTDTRNADLNLAQAGRYLLEDDPTEVTFRVTMRELQRQDVGLYQCVIDLSPRTPVVLPPRIWLVPCEECRWEDRVLNTSCMTKVMAVSTVHGKKAQGGHATYCVFQPIHGAAGIQQRPIGSDGPWWILEGAQCGQRNCSLSQGIYIAANKEKVLDSQTKGVSSP